MTERDHRLPVKGRADLLGISRGSVYDQPVPIPDAELALTRRVDRLHLGALMRRMGIQAP